ncbi:hypothetical protein BU26DRAFT_325183 [Trematosphaeria pertusa]|uniref:Uncharacterized protein n=1 Tax=Trematosphaeria pertusa TaxID=390896 RepID=A0A6A6IBN0_9PLEO|nr:uncharacterized protein BU26DRAFT_325183 [Trematosphaeria pertusa]KAF2247975.1 hypothetical protein BU26DRAFT_325183 [Trematosphaeria pertusa]
MQTDVRTPHVTRQLPHTTRYPNHTLNSRIKTNRTHTHMPGPADKPVLHPKANEPSLLHIIAPMVYMLITFIHSIKSPSSDLSVQKERERKNEKEPIFRSVTENKKKRERKVRSNTIKRPRT